MEGLEPGDDPAEGEEATELARLTAALGEAEAAAADAEARADEARLAARRARARVTELRAERQALLDAQEVEAEKREQGAAAGKALLRAAFASKARRASAPALLQHNPEEKSSSSGLQNFVEAETVEEVFSACAELELPKQWLVDEDGFPYRADGFPYRRCEVLAKNWRGQQLLKHLDAQLKRKAEQGLSIPADPPVVHSDYTPRPKYQRQPPSWEQHPSGISLSRCTRLLSGEESRA